MIGKRIALLRTKKELTQEELALKLGVSRSALSLWEQERRKVDPDFIPVIASFFNVTTDYILGASDTPNFSSPDISVAVLRSFREVVIPHIREETIKTFGPDAPSVKLCDEIDTFPIEQQKVFFNELVKRFYFDAHGILQFELHEPTNEEAAASLSELTDDQLKHLVESLSRDGRRKLLKLIANTDD